MGCTLEEALLSVNPRELEENVQLDTCYKRIKSGGCSGKSNSPSNPPGPYRGGGLFCPRSPRGKPSYTAWDAVGALISNKYKQ